MRVSRLRGALRLIVLALMTAVALPAYALCLGPLRRGRRSIQVLWSRLACRLVGLRLHVSGEVHRGEGTLFVANHVSYLDMPVLAQLIEARFVAKAEVAGWPLIGAIARVTGTVFVNRSAAEVRAQRRELRRLLAAGESLILFPEGTSTDGSAVAPFKPALMDVAAGEDGLDPVVQPVSVAYPRARDGTPLTGASTALYGWYGDMTLVPHLVRVAGLHGAEVDVRFHAPVRAGQFASRKALAAHCQAAVAEGVAAAHAGGRMRPAAAE